MTTTLSVLLFNTCIVGVMAKPESQVLIVFLFLALMIGAAITYILSRAASKLPYTVVVFAVGAGLAFMFEPIDDGDVLKQSEHMWNHMEPELILFMFLPALLFGEAMSLNFHHIRGAVIPSAVLAGPGALFGAFLLAVLVKYLLPFEWDWSLCFLLGAILCATDPVAVVALLKSSGASNKLTYVIIGEALMNDGTALVLYNLFYTLVKKDAGPIFTPLDVTIYFLRVIFISPLLGFAFGLVSLGMLALASRRMKEEDTTVQMATTICCAYLSFFVAEYVVKVSGVLCCCAAALTLARFAEPLILRHETIHSIWAAFEWIGNTLIFILAGLIIGSRTMTYVTLTDLLYILVVYIFTFLIRGVMMILCYPLLNRPELGKVITPQEAIFATWGGLRGAVSMALALSLVHSAENGKTTISPHDSHRVFFLAGGVAALTLLVNATTSGPLLEWLGLLESSNSMETNMMFSFVKKRIRIKAEELLEQLKTSRPDQIDAELVISYCSILRSHERKDIHPHHHHHSKVHEPRHDVACPQTVQSTPGDLGVEMANKSNVGHLSILSPSKNATNTTAPIALDTPHKVGCAVSRNSGLFEDGDLAVAANPAYKLFDDHGEHAEDILPQILKATAGDGGVPSRKLGTSSISASVRTQKVQWGSKSATDAGETTSTVGGTLPRNESAMSIQSTDSQEGEFSMQSQIEALRDGSFFTPSTRALAPRSTSHPSQQVYKLTKEEEAKTAPASPKRADASTNSAGVQSSGDASPTEAAAATRRANLRRFNSDVIHDDAELAHTVPQTFARPTMLAELLAHIRRAFLEVVRVSYWRQINSGKLPRKSSAALILLNSIDVALETTDTPGLQDWEVIEKEYRQYFKSQTNYIDPIHAMSLSFYRRQQSSRLGMFGGVSQHTDVSSHRSDKRSASQSAAAAGASVGGDAGAGGDLEGGKGPSTNTNSLDDAFRTVPDVDFESDASTKGEEENLGKFIKDHQDAQIVYLLTAFIDAHNYAQKRIPYYLGDTETIDTPEEALVVQESRGMVSKAKARLAAIDPEIVTTQVSKQTARWILHRQEDQVEEFLKKGIITERDAEELFHEAESDLKLLGKVEWTDIFVTMCERMITAADCSQRCACATSTMEESPEPARKTLSLRSRKQQSADNADTSNISNSV